MKKHFIYAVGAFTVLCSLAMTGCGSDNASSGSASVATKAVVSSTSSAVEEADATSSEQENDTSSADNNTEVSVNSETSADESQASTFDYDALLTELQHSDINFVTSELISLGTASVNGVEVPLTCFGAAIAFGDEFSMVEQYIYVDGNFSTSNLYVHSGSLTTPDKISEAMSGLLKAEKFEVIPDSEAPSWYVSSAPTGIAYAYFDSSMTDKEAYDAAQAQIAELREAIE